jgi:two-component system response regulator DesR
MSQPSITPQVGEHAQGEINVLSVDDNPMIGDVIELLARQTPGMRHAGHCVSEAGVLERVQRDDVRLLVLDYEIPGVDTLKLLRAVIASSPHCRVLMLSAHARPDIVEACRRAGASGYVIKDSDPSQIAAAMKKVAAGETSFSARMHHPGAASSSSRVRRLMKRWLHPESDPAQQWS